MLVIDSGLRVSSKPPLDMIALIGVPRQWRDNLRIDQSQANKRDAWRRNVSGVPGIVMESVGSVSIENAIFNHDRLFDILLRF